VSAVATVEGSTLVLGLETFTSDLGEHVTDASKKNVAHREITDRGGRKCNDSCMITTPD